MADFTDLAGVNPNTWNNLMNFGLATMAAGAQPGISTLGAIGQGGMASMQSARENAAARMQQQLGQQEIAQRQISNAQNLYNLQRQNMINQQYGLPTMQLPNIPGMQMNQMQIPQQEVQTAQAQVQSPSGYAQQPVQLAGGTLQAPTLDQTAAALPNYGQGSSQQTQPQPHIAQMQAAGLVSQMIPNKDLGRYIMDPTLAAQLTPDQAKQVVVAAKQTGFQVPAELEKFAYAGDIARNESMARLPAEMQMIQAREAARLGTEMRLPRQMEGVAAEGDGTGLPPGTKYQYFTTAGGHNQSQFGGKGPAISSEMSPSEREYRTVNAKEFADFGNEISDKATNGKAGNATIDQMVAEAGNAKTNALGDIRMTALKYKQAINQLFDPEGKISDEDKLNSFINVDKNGGKLLRDTLKSTYSRVTNLDMTSTGSTLPGVDTPIGGFILNASQLKAANDYNDAMSRYMQQWQKQNPNSLNKRDFLNDANKKFTPDAFWLNHLPDDMRKAAITNIRNSPNGEQRIKSLMKQREFLIRNNLYSAQEQ